MKSKGRADAGWWVGDFASSESFPVHFSARCYGDRLDTLLGWTGLKFSTKAYTKMPLPLGQSSHLRRHAFQDGKNAAVHNSCLLWKCMRTGTEQRYRHISGNKQRRNALTRMSLVATVLATTRGFLESSTTARHTFWICFYLRYRRPQGFETCCLVISV